LGAFVGLENLSDNPRLAVPIRGALKQ